MCEPKWGQRLRLNEKGPHGLIDLNILSLVGGTALEGLGDVTLLEEVCGWASL